MNNIISSTLYTQPSFIKGISRIIDMTGNLDEYNTTSTQEEADYIALKKDWEVIGNDIQRAIDTWDNELLNEKKDQIN